jgi:hypothetical protein
MNEDDDLESMADALAQSAQRSDEADAEAEYRARGRVFADLSDGDLIERLIEAVREHSLPEISDIFLEIDIRKLQLPIHAHAAVTKYANEMFRVGLVKEHLKRYLDEVDKPQH